MHVIRLDIASWPQGLGRQTRRWESLHESDFGLHLLGGLASEGGDCLLEEEWETAGFWTIIES